MGCYFYTWAAITVAIAKQKILYRSFLLSSERPSESCTDTRRRSEMQHSVFPFDRDLEKEVRRIKREKTLGARQNGAENDKKKGGYESCRVGGISSRHNWRSLSKGGFDLIGWVWWLNHWSANSEERAADDLESSGRPPLPLCLCRQLARSLFAWLLAPKPHSIPHTTVDRAHSYTHSQRRAINNSLAY